MSEAIKYRARAQHQLDCGDTVKEGETFVVAKSFICEEHARAQGLNPKEPERKPAQASQK